MPLPAFFIVYEPHFIFFAARIRRRTVSRPARSVIRRIQPESDTVPPVPREKAGGVFYVLKFRGIICSFQNFR